MLELYYKKLMKTFFNICIFVSLAVIGEASSPKNTNFRSPVKYKISLAGSFGELRSRHFHAGLDIKSKMGSGGDSIFAAEEGYISKIKIQRGGYGKVLYIAHPNGYTTVYAHLQSFNRELEQYVKSIQLAQMSYEVELYPSPDQFVFDQSQHIAFLGNTGRSYGPHLHFEIRESVSDNPMNPLLFGIKPIDNLPPVITSIRVVGLSPEYQKLSQTNFKMTKNKKGYYPSVAVEVPAFLAGISIAGYDQIDGNKNKNGIYKLQMYVNGVLHYSATMDRISFDKTLQIDAYTDYEVKAKERKTEILCYRLPGNSLDFIDTEINNGIIDISSPQYQTIEVIAHDYDGNKVSHVIQIRSKEINTSVSNNSEGIFIYQGISNFVPTADVKATIYENCLAKNCVFAINDVETFRKGKEYQIGTSSIPLLKPIKLVTKIPDDYLTFIDKLSFMKLGNQPTSYGHAVQGDSITIFTDEFGRYGFFLDTLAPIIKPLLFSFKTKSDQFKFKIYDNVNTRLDARPFTYQVWIDDQWLPCEYKEMNETLYVPLNDLYQGDHSIKIIVSDQFGNERKWESLFSK